MLTHTFAICAYKDSPYLEECIRSLKHQSVRSEIILCTSTPSAYLEEMAGRYGLPYYVREGESDIQADWNFAFEKASGRLVTIAHQDDSYHKDYVKYVQHCWERYPDTTVFTTDCAIVKNGKLQRPGLVALVKHILRLPLRFHCLANRTLVKKAALCFGNPIICPSCTYDKEALELPLFSSPYKFALDWDTMWKLASRPGRFYCEERPLIRYRVHDGSETKKCIEDQRRSRDEIAMFRQIWPEPIVRILMIFYKKAYGAYD
jgi:glycosyltransferase involved in cell wall biosynthesis